MAWPLLSQTQACHPRAECLKIPQCHTQVTPTLWNVKIKHESLGTLNGWHLIITSPAMKRSHKRPGRVIRTEIIEYNDSTHLEIKAVETCVGLGSSRTTKICAALQPSPGLSPGRASPLRTPGTRPRPRQARRQKCTWTAPPRGASAPVP